MFVPSYVLESYVPIILVIGKHRHLEKEGAF